MQTTDSVRSVKGVGEKAEQNLHKLKIETVGELLEHYPRNYDETSRFVRLKHWKKEI